MKSATTNLSERNNTVLVVEDEAAISGRLAMALRRGGFQVTVVATGYDAIEIADTLEPDLVVLDRSLPDVDGQDVLRRLRAQGHWGLVILLTGNESSEDRTRNRSLGADDYLSKPFGIAELVARVHLSLRRSHTSSHPSILAFADLRLDQESLEVWRGENRISLTATEFQLLRYLMAQAPKVVSKQQILDDVWDYDFTGNDNVVETYISYLRKKISGAEPPLIYTVRGYGYVLKTPVQP
jgi:two-component system OmpR family response regulator